jgi:hypothetical protein
VLQEQAVRVEGEESIRLLKEAVAAHRAALTVFTREQLPQFWAQTQSNLAETYFISGQFVEAEKALGTLLRDPDAASNIKANTQIALEAIEIATLLALGRTGAIFQKTEVLREVIAKQPRQLGLSWNFEATKHFISQNEALVPFRDSLVGLFDALQERDRNAVLASLQALQNNVSVMDKN